MVSTAIGRYAKNQFSLSKDRPRYYEAQYSAGSEKYAVIQVFE